MNSEVLAWILGMASPILVATITFYFQRMQKKRDKKEEKQTEARRREMRLVLDLLVATAKLSYASAEAIKRGKPNGEIEEGEEAYKSAMEEFQNFERDQISRL